MRWIGRLRDAGSALLIDNQLWPLEPLARPVWMKITGAKPDPYDSQAFEIIRRTLRQDSVCIDIGCHKGLILDAMIRQAPYGVFRAFEPIPHLAGLLRSKYRANSRVTVHECALSDSGGETVFYINKRDPGYSGLSPRQGAGGTGNEVEACTVALARLDDVLPDIRPDFIKIDVEGAELGVLKGAAAAITQWQRRFRKPQSRAFRMMP